MICLQAFHLNASVDLNGSVGVKRECLIEAEKEVFGLLLDRVHIDDDESYVQMHTAVKLENRAPASSINRGQIGDHTDGTARNVRFLVVNVEMFWN